MSRMTISDAGLQMLKRFEGFRESGLALPDGQWLIGHGSLRMAPLSQPMTREQAHHDLLMDLKPYEDMIHTRVRVPLAQAQFDALTSFSFSIGLAAFERSEVLRRLNAGDVIAAAVAIDAWRKSRFGGQTLVLDALVRRRALERAMLLESEDDPVAPSVLVRPQIDHALAILGAPVGFARMPSLEEAVLAAAVPEDHPPDPAHKDAVAHRIATILAQQPATAIALAAPATVPDHDEPFDFEGPGDLPPPPSPTDKTGVSAPRPAADAAAVGAARPASRRVKTFQVAMDTIALMGLLMFGLALLSVAGLTLAHGDAADGGALTAAILGAPGALAVAMAAFYLVRGQDDR